MVPKCLRHPEEWIWVRKEKGVVEKGEPGKCRSPEAGVGEEVVKSPARSCREEGRRVLLFREEPRALLGFLPFPGPGTE